MKKIPEKIIILSIFIFFLSVFLLIMAGGVGGDGIAYYNVAKSIILNKSLSVDMEGIPGRDGKMYLPYGITYSLVMIPFYFLGLSVSNFLTFMSKEYTMMFFVSLANSFISALTCVVIFLFARKLGFLRKTGLTLVIIYVFTTTALSYSKTTFCEPLNSLLMLCGVMFLYLYKVERKANWLIAAAVFFGMGVLTKFYDIVVLPVAVWYIWPVGKEISSTKKNRMLLDMLNFLLTLSVSLIIWGLINYIKFGDFLKTGYKNYSFSTFYSGFYGLLFSSGRSFFLYNPVTIMGILGLRMAYRVHKKVAILFTLVVLVHFISISLLPIWSGGLAWGPRYLFPIIPYLILPVGALIENCREHIPVKMCILLLCCILGSLIQLPSVIIDFAGWEDVILNMLKLPDEVFLFIPNFSPILGSWILLYSAFQRICYGHSLIHVFDLGGVTTEVSLSGYDKLNFWFSRLFSACASPRIHIYTYMVLAIILFAMVSSIILLSKVYKE